MISILIGTCEERTTDSVTILTQAGIGYELFPSLLLQSHLAPQSPQKIYIHHHITEAGQTLFGFYAPEERTLFRRLIKISGVGGKTALSLINLGVHALISALEQSDEKFISQAQGVGKKMALKIIIELKKDVDAHMLLPASGEIPLAPVHHHDVLDTLVGMGYDRRKVEQILANLPEEITSLQDMTVYCLRQLSAR